MNAQTLAMFRLFFVVMLTSSVGLVGRQVPRALAATVIERTDTTITYRTGRHPIGNTRADNFTWECPSDYPYSINWKNNSSSKVTATESGTGLKSRKIHIDFYNWATIFESGGRSFGIIYTCSKLWFPAVTNPDCGGEGQRVCWGAVMFNGWRRRDWMRAVSGRTVGECDHGLITTGITEDSKCKNHKRHQLGKEGKAGVWQTWAIDHQIHNLAAREPINWIPLIGTHNSYNVYDEPTGQYPFPNQRYSISDQLDAGARWIDLRARWGVTIGNFCVGVNDACVYLRLSHGTNDCGGCSGKDRPFMFGIQEIGKWLNDNPTQIIGLSVGQFDGGADVRPYITDPIKKYFGSKVLGPAEWCGFLLGNRPNGKPRFPRTPDELTELGDRGNTLSCAGVPDQSTDANGNATSVFRPYRWPTIAEMQNPDNWACRCRKQVIIKTGGGGWDSDVAFGVSLQPDAQGDNPSFSRKFDAAGCKRDGHSALYHDVGRVSFYRNFVEVSEARVFGQAVADKDTWPGYIYAYNDEIPTEDGRNDLAAPRPYQSEGTSVEALINCNISLSFDMFRGDQHFNGTASPISGMKDRRDAVIWTWAKDDYATQEDSAAVLRYSDKRFHTEAPTAKHHVACAQETTTGSGMYRTGDPYSWIDPAGSKWVVTRGTYSWWDASQACRDEFPGYVFAVPVNKWQADRLQEVNTGQHDLWLSYTNNVISNQWTVAAPPSVSAGPFTVDEGSSLQLRAAGISPNGATLTYAWDLDHNGSFETPGQTAMFSAASIDGPATKTIAVKVTDSNGLSSTRQTTVTINNVAPTITANAAPLTITEHNLVTVTGTISDPSPLDSFTLVIDWRDGTSNTYSYPAGTRTYRESHLYLDDNPSATASDVNPIELRLTDDDGGAGTTSTSVTINNVNPVARIDTLTDDSGAVIGSTDVLLQGLTVAVATSYTDVGTRDTRRATMNWNDGTAVSDLGAVGASKNTEHIYASSGTYTMRLTATDDDTGTGIDTRQVRVVTPIGATQKAIADLGNVTSQNPVARAALQSALDNLQGNNGGRASNGTLDKLEQGNLIAAMVMLKKTLVDLQKAEASDPTLNLTPLKRLLSLMAKSVAVEQINGAGGSQTIAHNLVAQGQELLVRGDFIGAVGKFEEAIKRAK